MAFDFSISPRVEKQRQQIADFVAAEVIPVEQQVFREGLTDTLRVDLQTRAKAAGVFAPQAPEALGGGGFRFDESAVLLEEAGYSLLGPLALNCAAPDEGNIHLLHLTGTAEQQGAVPRAPGRRQGPLLLLDDRAAARAPAPTRAPCGPAPARVDGGWVVNGEKWLITGADGAAFSIVMALNEGDGRAPGRDHVPRPRGQPRLRRRRPPQHHRRHLPRRPLRVSLRDCFVPDADVLGEPGRGLPRPRCGSRRRGSRTACAGSAQRGAPTTSPSSARVERELFGSTLSDLGMAQALIAENEIDLDAARSMIWHASWAIAEGSRSSEESSRTKVFASEAVCRVVDRSVQLAGGMGTSEELVLGRIYRDIRSFRIYDGATEVHKMSIAKRAARRAARATAARIAREPGGRRTGAERSRAGGGPRPAARDVHRAGPPRPCPRLGTDWTRRGHLRRPVQHHLPRGGARRRR